MLVKTLGRRRWKKVSGYHRQGRVENTFFRYKSIIGDGLRARSPAGQGSEVVLGCEILNRMTALGRPVSYPPRQVRILVGGHRGGPVTIRATTPQFTPHGPPAPNPSADHRDRTPADQAGRRDGAPGREVLAGLVERVTFHNPETGFCVLRIKARGHRDLVTAVGHAATIFGRRMDHRLRRMDQRPDATGCNSACVS